MSELRQKSNTISLRLMSKELMNNFEQLRVCELSELADMSDGKARRRVYDALNVMEASGVIRKHGQWFVLPRNRDDPLRNKRKRLQDLALLSTIYEKLIVRNEKDRYFHQKFGNSGFFIPTGRSTKVSIKSSAFGTCVMIRSDSALRMISFNEVLTRIFKDTSIETKEIFYLVS